MCVSVVDDPVSRLLYCQSYNPVLSMSSPELCDAHLLHSSKIKQNMKVNGDIILFYWYILFTRSSHSKPMKYMYEAIYFDKFMKESCILVHILELVMIMTFIKFHKYLGFSARKN